MKVNWGLKERQSVSVMEMNHACTNTLISFTPLQTPIYSIYTRVMMIPANCSVLSWIYFISLICHSGEEWFMKVWESKIVNDENDVVTLSFDLFRDHPSAKNSWMIHEINVNQCTFSFHACVTRFEPWLQIHNANI